MDTLVADTLFWLLAACTLHVGWRASGHGVEHLLVDGEEAVHDVDLRDRTGSAGLRVKRMGGIPDLVANAGRVSYP